MPSLKVKAVEGRCVPIFESNTHTLGRFVGREKNKLVDGKIAPGAIKAGGEEVPDSTYYRRAIDRGDLEEIVTEKQATKKESAQ